MYARCPATLILGMAAVSFAAWCQQDETRTRCSADTPQACLDGASSAVTGYDSLRVAGNRRAGARGADDEPAPADAYARQLISYVLGGAGNAGYDAWISYARSDFEGTVSIAPYDASLDSVLIGFDRMVGAGTLSVVVNLERRKTDTTYNGGGEDGDGFGVSLFGVHPLDDRTSIDWAAGYSALSTDQGRIDPASTPGAPDILTASFDSKRWFATGNVLALQSFGTWLLAGRGGLLYAREDAEGYTEQGGASARTVRDRRTQLLQLALGAELAYAAAPVEPYLFLGYRRDLDRDAGADAGDLPAGIETQPDDRDEAETALGVRYFARSFSLSAEWLHTFTRDNFRNDTASLLLRSEF